MTRLDQLDEKVKRVAQSASVIGREFLFPILQCINDSNVALDESIHTLEDSEWITEEYIEAEKIYRFKHVLSRDIAYNSLLFKRRKEIHGKIAHCLRQIDDSLFDEIGRHFFEAGSLEDAVPFIIKAAEAAVRTNSTSEAISMLSQVEQFSEQVTDFGTLISVYLVLGTAYAMEGKNDESTNYYSLLLDRSREKDDQRGEVRALNKLAENALYASNDVSQADEYLKRAEEIGNLVNFSEGLVETSAMRCVMHQSLGEFDKAAEYETKGLNFSKSMNDGQVTISFKYNLIVSHVFSLKLNEAEILIREFLDEYEKKGEQYFVSSVYGSLYPITLILRGQFNLAIEMATKGLMIAEEIKAPFPIYLGSQALGEIYLQTGDFQKAEKYFKMSVDASTKNNNFGFLASSTLSLALAKIYSGRKDEELIAEGLKSLDQKDGSFWGGRSLGVLGYYYLFINNFGEARRYFDLALTLSNAPTYVYKPINLLGKTRVLIEESSFSEAKTLIVETRDYCERYGILQYNAERLFLSGVIEYHQDQFELAINYLTEAYHLAKDLGFKQLLLEILSYKTKIHRLSQEMTIAEKLDRELKDLVGVLSSQFESNEKKKLYVKSIEHLI
jgi:tetratricopeptide (TPR) repeat protein